MGKYDVHAVLAALEAGEWIAVEEEVILTCGQAHNELLFHPNGHKRVMRRFFKLAEPLVSRETED
jgi:hypothetical protein